jgi:microcystin-dependent protein
MENFIGEIRIFGGNFSPAGWHYCDGSLLSISDYDALFALIGTTYGGDGVTTFALPDLRGRIIVSQGTALSGTTYAIGSMGGAEQVTLVTNSMPSHSHTFTASTSAGTTTSAASNFLAAPVDPTTNNKTVELYEPAGTSVTTQAMLPGSITQAGNSQPHENRMPFLTISYIIALQGIFPSFN